MSEAVRDRLVRAAIDLLRTKGAKGMTARAVAAASGHNQALIYYHFGGLKQLMAAALAEVSRTRLDRYEPLLSQAHDISAMVTTVRQVFVEDVNEGWVKVLVEVMVSAIGDPYLSGEVARLLAPWIAVTERAIQATPLSSLTDVPPRDAALICVALFVGLDVLQQLDGDPLGVTRTIEDSSDAAARLAAMLGGLRG